MSIESLRSVSNHLEAVLQPGKVRNISHEYVVIDPHTGKMGLTRDESKASSMKDLASFTQKVIEDHFFELGGSPEGRALLETLGRQFEQAKNKYKVLSRLVHFPTYQKIKQVSRLISNTPRPSEVVEQTQIEHPVAEEKHPKSAMKKKGAIKKGGHIVIRDEDVKEHDYGLDPVTRRHFQYADTETARWSFKRILDTQTVDQGVIIDAFMHELTFNWKREGEFLAAVSFLKGHMTDVLNNLANDVEKGAKTPEEASVAVGFLLAQAIRENNRESITVNRDEFAVIVGSLVGGKSRMNRRLPYAVDPENPTIKKLVAQYKSNEWKDPEEKRPFEIEHIREGIARSVSRDLKRVFENPEFTEVLLRYFQEL